MLPAHAEIARFRARTACLAAIALACVPTPSNADCVFTESSKLTVDDDSASARFGYALAVAGDIAVIGASNDDDSGIDAGAAYVFRYLVDDESGVGAWVEEQKLLASDGALADYFGSAVATDGEVVLVGAWFANAGATDSGAAYVFRHDGSEWVEEQKLYASDGEASEYFGVSVAIGADSLLIGAIYDDENGAGSGSVYIFELVSGTWSERDKLAPEDGAASDNFGIAISVSGDAALIGARWCSDNGTDAGAAYVFREDGDGDWIEEQKLLPRDGRAYDRFGSAVALSGDQAIIGAFFDDDQGPLAGSAYAFHLEAGVWVEVQELAPDDITGGDEFGNSVAIAGDRAVVGSYTNADNAENAGLAYRYRLDGDEWIEDGRLAPAEPGENDLFGFSVAIAGDVALVGAIHEDEQGTDEGAVYVYSLDVACPIQFVRGDTNADGSLNLADAVFALGYLFTSGESPSCLAAADSNADDTLSIGDPLLLLRYLFLAGADLAAPFPECGPASSAPSALPCQSFPTCR